MPRKEQTAQLLTMLKIEIERQDDNHPNGYPATRDGLRLALAAIEDELSEAYDEWQANRRNPDSWGNLGIEMLQIAAVAVRAVRSIYDVAADERRKMSADPVLAELHADVAAGVAITDPSCS